jgi:hypothetical protein
MAGGRAALRLLVPPAPASVHSPHADIEMVTRACRPYCAAASGSSAAGKDATPTRNRHRTAQ